MKKLHFYFSIAIGLMLLGSGNAWSQISFTENFEDGAADGWTDPDGWYYLDIPNQTCSNYMYITFLYTDYAGMEAAAASPAIGVSNGGVATLTYDYKIALFSVSELPLQNDPAWGTVKVEYATSVSGPWTAIDVVTPSNHVVSTSCATRTASFTPAEGSTIYLRLNAIVSDSPGIDAVVYFDNISVAQVAPCTVSAPNELAATQAVCTDSNIGDLDTGDYNTILWYTDATGGTPLASNIPVTESTYYAAQFDECESILRKAVAVTVTAADEPEVESPQLFEDTDVALYDDIAVDATGTVKWYATEANAIDGENALPETTTITVSGTYYVTQTISGCESEPATVVIDITLGSGEFSVEGLMYYPNPAGNMLHLSARQEIQNVVIYDLLGKQLISSAPKEMEADVDLSSLTPGTYVAKIVSGGSTAVVKIVKQ